MDPISLMSLTIFLDPYFHLKYNFKLSNTECYENVVQIIKSLKSHARDLLEQEKENYILTECIQVVSLNN